MRDLTARRRRRGTLGEEGQGMVEYALIILLVACVVFAALTLFGPSVANVYNHIGNSLVI